jgi:hypothetical protein
MCKGFDLYEQSIPEKEIKAEAYKEFAERIKIETGYLFSADSIEVEVDNLLIELVGDE